MRIESIREFKSELRRDVVRLRVERVLPPTPATSVAVGAAVRGPGDFGVAVRYAGPFEVSDIVVRRARELAGDDCDVRQVGVIRAFQWGVDDLQRRHRPLRPGLSIAHVDVTAGTIGAFVVPAEGSDAAVRVLSNNHVLANSDRGRPGDVVVQPGPADGGADPADRIGTLEAVVPLDLAATNLVDAAVARLDDGVEVDIVYPAGKVTEWVPVTDALEVEKVGRTTGQTRGRVTAVELDDVSVEYPVGTVMFDDQVEVSGVDGPFSDGGDSGSLVYSDTRQAVGLLFAGSEAGGDNGQGLTYCNPIGPVLDRLGVRLLSSP